MIAHLFPRRIRGTSPERHDRDGVRVHRGKVPATQLKVQLVAGKSVFKEKRRLVLSLTIGDCFDANEREFRFYETATTR